MIGLDTNVVVRLFVDDDPDQARRARQFVREHCSRENPGFIDRVALCEAVWVLSTTFGYGHARVGPIVEELLISDDIVIEDRDQVELALGVYRKQNVDFADVLIANTNRANGCEATATFDRKAAARLNGFVPIP